MISNISRTHFYASYLLSRPIRNQSRRLHHHVTVRRDVPYSTAHPRNVLDIYEPGPAYSKASEADVASRTRRPPTLLFVHGGMWLRGSKDQQGLSPYEAASRVLSAAFSSSEAPVENETAGKEFSNVGVTVAKHGGSSYAINYRLAGATYRSKSSMESSNETKLGVGDEGGHPNQVIDVARAIAYVIDRELRLRHDSDRERSTPNIFVMGHSAGAHLAALALSDSSYVKLALSERGLKFSTIHDVIAGCIGVSGVYNLKRLAVNPLAAITIGPAFGSETDALTEASPVHVLLRAHAEIAKKMPTAYSERKETMLPPLVRMPLLLLNAESDFHLKQDTAELLVALRHYDCCGTNDIRRQHAEISGSDHLSIIRRFGLGMMSDIIVEETSAAATASASSAINPSLTARKPLHSPGQGKTWMQKEAQADQPDLGWTTWTMEQAFTALEKVPSAVLSYFTESQDAQEDETALKVLQFMSLLPGPKK